MMDLHRLNELVEKLSRLGDTGDAVVERADLIKDCTAADLEWLAKEFERRAWKENEVAFALRRIQIDRK